MSFIKSYKHGRFAYLLFFICGIAISTSVLAQKDKRLKGVEKELNTILETTNAAGFSVAVVEGKKIIYAKGFGYSDYENKIPADANTLFAIGSSTKAFTSAILGQLRDEEKLSFDESPLKYIDDFKFQNDDMNNNIIIQDLMSHRTGLPRHDYSWYLFPSYNKDSLLQRVQYQEPFTGVRQRWYYNNFMFLAQGVIAERITEKSWEDNIKERFFAPLGMTRSNTTIDELVKSTNVAIGYEVKEDKVHKMDYYRIAGMAPAGSINSSANEMSNWVITWINNGKFKGKEILSESYRNEAIGSHAVVNSALPDKEVPDAHFANYGNGWFLSSYKSHYRVEHGGNIDGFSASVAFYPSDSIGIVVLANQNGSAVPGLVRNTIADRMLKEKRTDWIKRYTDAQAKSQKAADEAKDDSKSANIPNTKPSHILQEYTGEYSNEGYGKFNITVEKDSLFANFERMKFYLKHYHYDIFEPFRVEKTGIDTTDSGPLRFNFTTNNSGDISGATMQVEPTIDPITFKRKPTSIEVSKETLEQYVGNYELGPMTMKIYVKEAGTTLYAFVKGQPEYELIATDKHKFSLKIIDGYKIEFLEDDNQKINALSMIQPNGTFKATRKK